ncbi:MAG TPA: MaoC family dehydratase N-terminal domain-containing protein [Jiangellales bacterium]|nr:MaoC family dehydratase N-terminal domain-containing protein [Jiangellales bacterium]
MPLDASFAGRTYPPTGPYEVGREKIREFADAIGDPEPAYRDPEAARALGHPDVVAPPTFAVIVAFRGIDAITGDPELGLDFSRVVHGDQRFRYDRPLRAGDRVTATAVVETVRSIGGNDILGVRCDLATEDGEAVGSAWSTLVARGESA